jgi:hypothetical protein
MAVSKLILFVSLFMNSFSVPRGVPSPEEEKLIKQQMILTEAKASSEEKREIEGIVSVHTVDTDIFGNVLPETTSGGRESVLEQLRNIPQFYPLIKNSIDSSSSLFLSPTSLLSGTNVKKMPDIDPSLDRLDEKALIDICAEFQTYVMQQSRSISARQDTVLNRLEATEMESLKLVKDLTITNEQLKRLNSVLRDAERLNRFVVQCNHNVQSVISRLEELEKLLPHSVKSQISTPLFAHSLE